MSDPTTSFEQQATIEASADTDVGRAWRRLNVIVDALACPRCHRQMRPAPGGMFLPGLCCGFCAVGVIATDEWRDAMRALGSRIRVVSVL